MANELKLLRQLGQTYGLTGRKTRTPLVQKYADRVINRRLSPVSGEAPQELAPAEMHEGANELPVNEIAFGGTPAEKAVLAARSRLNLFGYPAYKSAKTALMLKHLGAPAGIIAKGALGGFVAPAAIKTILGAPSYGVYGKTAAQEIDAATSDLAPEKAQSEIDQGLRALETGGTAFREASPAALGTATAIQRFQKRPRTPLGMLWRYMKKTGSPQKQEIDLFGANPSRDSGSFDFSNFGPQANEDPNDTGGFDFGKDPGGTSPNFDASDTGGFDFEGGNPTSQGMQDIGGAGGADGGGGGTVLCGELFRQGIMPRQIYMADVAYAGTLDQDVLKGYRVWAKPVAKLMAKSKVFTAVLKYPVMSWASHMGFYGSGARIGRPTRFGRLAEAVGCPVCKLIGKVARFLNGI